MKDIPSSRIAALLPAGCQFTVDPEGNIHDWPDAAEDFFGLGAHDAIGRPLAGILPDFGSAPDAWRETRVRRGGDVTTALYRTGPASEDGRIAVAVLEHVAPRPVPSPSDETDRMARLLVASIVDYAIYMLDPEGHVASWNIGAERAKGYRAEEIVGHHFSCFYPEDQRALGAPATALETARRAGRFEAEGWRLRKDGSRFWAMVVIDAVYDEAGALIGFAKITKDCTERNRAEAEARSSERKFRLLVQGVTDYAIYMLDPEGRVANWNAGAERAKGYAETEILGRHFSVFYEAGDRADGLPAKALRTAREAGRYEGTGWRLRKDGSRFWANVVVTAIYDGADLIGFAKITRDISRQKADEERLAALIAEQRDTTRKLEAAVRAAEVASVAKSTFLANMSHEIRTPLNGILGMTELVLDCDLAPRPRQFVDTIASSGDALLRVLNDVLDFSKIEAGAIVLDPVSFDLRDLCEQVAILHEPGARKKGVEVIVDCGAEIPARMRGDAGRIRQIVNNLVANAAKFTHAGHILVAVRPAEMSGGRPVWRIEVTDTGIGIPADKLETIFEAFSQAESATTRLYGGTGLGLTISNRLVELMEGRMGVRAANGGGTTFWVELPLDPVADPAPGETAADGGLAPSPILIVDDNEVNRLILSEQCRAWGLAPETAVDGADAIAKLGAAARAGRPFPLILLDYHMPGLDGMAVAEWLEREAPSAHGIVVVLSSGDDDATISAFRARGVQDYLVKPVRQRRLFESLAALTRSAGALPAPAGMADGRDIPPGPVAARRSVLVAEDNKVNWMVVSGFLKAEPFDLTWAVDGPGAVEALRERHFDALLLDVSIPGYDGFEVVRRIRARESQEGLPRLPVILLTAHSYSDRTSEIATHDVDAILLKPTRKAELLETLRRYL
ncbi:PAS domain S-box protein [Palleronia aestuarii]|uniref:PAS domain S-box protein n=1 Tax=Palleronia aestuarii TaxID=568105 RepID=UPI00147457CB|nr:PAS domain S-box protein [Palleronia aestuarii]